LQSAHERQRGSTSPALTSMQALIEAQALPIAERLVADGDLRDCVKLQESGQLLAPIPRPIQLRDGLCFIDHLKNGMAMAAKLGHTPNPAFVHLVENFHTRPFWYNANHLCVCGPDTNVIWPPYSQMIDYELEMAVVIGKGGRDIAPEDAHDHIFGYSIFNDFSARDVQASEMATGMGVQKSKGFDNSNGLGPCIVTADEFDPYNATMIAYINGEKVSENTSATITHRFDSVIAWMSKHETLHAGEIFCSGTVPGGSGAETGRFLKPGDMIDLEIVGIGRLRHTISRT
ncbi:MAG TPA: fumarylacetoacetate hydrolase family protein, partial [Verrucomicrobiae bacterium]|nr:fumarylacetoacetate hydrolase family protein [Verrucomicrobiae bacterium]